MRDELVTSARFTPTLRERLVTCWLVMVGWSDLRVRVSVETEWEIGATGTADWAVHWVPWWRGLFTRMRERVTGRRMGYAEPQD